MDPYYDYRKRPRSRSPPSYGNRDTGRRDYRSRGYERGGGERDRYDRTPADRSTDRLPLLRPESSDSRHRVDSPADSLLPAPGLLDHRSRPFDSHRPSPYGDRDRPSMSDSRYHTTLDRRRTSPSLRGDDGGRRTPPEDDSRPLSKRPRVEDTPAPIARLAASTEKEEGEADVEEPPPPPQRPTYRAPDTHMHERRPTPSHTDRPTSRFGPSPSGPPPSRSSDLQRDSHAYRRAEAPPARDTPIPPAKKQDSQAVEPRHQSAVPDVPPLSHDAKRLIDGELAARKALFDAQLATIKMQFAEKFASVMSESYTTACQHRPHATLMPAMPIHATGPSMPVFLPLM